ncbi:MAG: hypothetical protein H0U53_08120, partial [Actinobacteria bacterium]|nr:hypothetical protein [Actinomycetota bacterium]
MSNFAFARTQRVALVLVLALLVVTLGFSGRPARSSIHDQTDLVEALTQLEVPAKVPSLPGLDGALSLAAQRRDHPLRRPGLQRVGDRVQVQIVARDPAAAKKALVRAGGGVQFAHRNLIQALAPISALKGLAEHPDIRRIESMRPPETFATAGQGVGAINASSWHQTGFTGTGVKIAVVDSGFAGYQARQAAGDLPQNLVLINKCANGFEATTEHGAGVAEIVHEVAPAASLYLICVDGPVGAATAVTYAKDNGIGIISSSIGSAGWSRGDGNGGTGTWDAVVRSAVENGILWINAAGNYANGGHWSGNFSDADGDGRNDFTSSDEFNDLYMPAGAIGCITLKWDNWPASSNDFDLYLLRTSDAAVVAKSEYA